MSLLSRHLTALHAMYVTQLSELLPGVDTLLAVKFEENVLLETSRNGLKQIRDGIPEDLSELTNDELKDHIDNVEHYMRAHAKILTTAGIKRI